MGNRISSTTDDTNDSIRYFYEYLYETLGVRNTLVEYITKQPIN